jgi:Protein of unknown function DUF262
MTITDAQINAKYESGTNRLILENDRIKLSKLVKNIKSHPNYMMISSDWSSSWNEITKSRLIESFLINVPVMPIIVYEKNYKSYEVIDGRERLKTIVDLYSDRLTLTGLEVETDLDNCSYSTCPINVKQRLNNYSLSLINCIPASEEQSEPEIKKLIDAVKKRYRL